MDLVRQILMAVEKHPEPDEAFTPGIEGYSPEEISYHVKLLHQAGLIEAHENPEVGTFEFLPKYLTWEGHEFLDASRDDNKWNKAKQLVLKTSGGLSFEVIKYTLLEMIRRSVSAG